MVPVHSQNFRHFTAQALYVVAIALLAKLAEAGQVLPDLGGSQSHRFGKGAG